MKGVFLCDLPQNIARVWNTTQREQLAEMVELHPDVIQSAQMPAYADWLAESEVIFSTWGMPLLNNEQLSMLPRLRALFYAAGTVKEFAYPLLERNIVIANAAAANAIPVAEYSLSQILFSLKLGWQHLRQLQTSPGPSGWMQLSLPGCYKARVGVISLGLIGSKLCELLKNFSVHVLAYDPFVKDETFRDLGAKRAPLTEIFRDCDVISIHTPLLPKTEGMITGRLIGEMKLNATLINTSRGALIRENELAQVLKSRSDLTAVLDVTCTEPPEAGSPLYQLPNIILTPHIAGACGNEVNRMADMVHSEFKAWREGRALRHAVQRELIKSQA